VRLACWQLLFPHDAVFKEVRETSGGVEKHGLRPALIASRLPAILLCFDEPTNHPRIPCQQIAREELPCREY